MNLVDGLKGSNVWFCVSVAIFGLAHGDDFAWQVQYFGCLKLISHGGRCAQYLVTFFRTSLCGVLVFDSVSRVLLLLLLSSSASAAPPLSHTIFVTHLSHTHFLTHHLCHTRSLSHSILVTHTHLSHTTLSHTIFAHNFVTHDLCHTSFTNTFLHTLCHTRSLSHTIFVTHTHLSHTQLCHTRSSPSFTHTAWQAWRLVTSRRGSLRGRQHLWHWAGDIYLHFAWQAWRLWRWAGSGGALGLGLVAGRRGTWRGRRGRRGTWRHVPSFHVAGVALGDSHLRFVCQAWLALVACLGWD